jgi:quinol monooxygenase YgiN
MPVYWTASYTVKGEALPKVLQAVTDSVAYVRENEAGTLAYSAWQDAAEPVRFVHHIVFADAGAHQVHRSSRAVQRFTAVLYPEGQGQVASTESR